MSSEAIVAVATPAGDHHAEALAIRIQGVGKCFQIYEKPRHRLQQFIFPQLSRMIGRTRKAYYKEFWALRNLSFDIRKGETVGIIGKNGSGKSTLLQIICGTLTPTEGSVETNGRIAALLELGSGFNPEFTGRENVYLNGTVLGLTTQEIDARFEDILSFADIGDFIDQPVKTYSSGMMVRLAFAVAINANPEILVVDEALSVGDELFQRKCFSRIEAIRDNGATILFVSHSGSTIVELCDRAVLIDSGELLTAGEPKKIVGQYQKLLYAAADKKAAIREEIKHGFDLMLASPKHGEARAANSMHAHTRTEAGHEEVAEERYNPELKPASTIEYESRGAVIHDPEIRTLDDVRVNCLKRGRTYRYIYRVKFLRDASNIRFGMMIKTISGVDLGGAVSASASHESIAQAAAGTTLCVEFEFTCALNPATYFLNAGVQGCVDGDDTYLHRLLDVAMFQVLPESRSLSTGTVHFNCLPKSFPV